MQAVRFVTVPSPRLRRSRLLNCTVTLLDFCYLSCQRDGCTQFTLVVGCVLRFSPLQDCVILLFLGMLVNVADFLATNSDVSLQVMSPSVRHSSSLGAGAASPGFPVPFPPSPSALKNIIVKIEDLLF